MAINLENLNSAFSAASESVSELKNTSRQELVPLEDIVTAEFNPYNENDNDETVEQLAQSIEAYGLIEPLCVNKDSDGKYHLISGERRYKAISRLKWKTVPCVVYDALEAVQAELRLHEANLETREYTSAQKFSFYKRVRELLEKLRDEGKLTGGLQKNIANMLHVSERQVRKYDSIAQLDPEIQKSVEKGSVSINSAYKLAHQNDKAETNIQERTAEDNNTAETEFEVYDGSSNDNANEAAENSKDQSNNIERYKLLESVIPEMYNHEELMLYYLRMLPTPKEAGKDFLKPPSGHRELHKFNFSCELDNSGVSVSSNGETEKFTYTDVDECVRNLIRSRRLVNQMKHDEILNFLKCTLTSKEAD